ncbi:protein Frey 1 [Morphnus guianensis]
MRCWLLLLTLLLGAALPRPLSQRGAPGLLAQGLGSLLPLVFLRRVSYLVPEDFSAPLELPQQHFGLVDDYGIKPKQPRFRTWAARERPAALRRAGKSKRDELDLLEYYYDARL